MNLLENKIGVTPETKDFQNGSPIANVISPRINKRDFIQLKPAL